MPNSEPYIDNNKLPKITNEFNYEIEVNLD